MYFCFLPQKVSEHVTHDQSMGNVGYQNYYTLRHLMGFPAGSDGEKSACSAGDLGLIPGSGRSPGEEWHPTPIFLPGESPRAEEPGGIQSTGVQRVRHD